MEQWNQEGIAKHTFGSPRRTHKKTHTHTKNKRRSYLNDVYDVRTKSAARSALPVSEYEYSTTDGWPGTAVIRECALYRRSVVIEHDVLGDRFISAADRSILDRPWRQSLLHHRRRWRHPPETPPAVVLLARPFELRPAPVRVTPTQITIR